MNTIYIITNKINNKQYIGSTIIEPQKRFKQHIYNSTHKNTHQYNYPLYQAMRKYGIDNFNFEIILQKDCSEEEIRLIEKEYIIQYNSLCPNGYNQTLNTLHPINDIETYNEMATTLMNYTNLSMEKAKEVVQVITDGQGAIIEIVQKWRSIVDCAEETGLDEKKIAAVCRGERKTTGGKTL